MPLGPEILLKLVEQNKLVENLSERELKNPEGAGFDLRLGEVHELLVDSKKSPFLGIEDRDTPATKLVLKFKDGEEGWHVLKPGDYVLVKTMEKVNLPNDLTGHIFTRSTLFRSGLSLQVTQVAPGYKGELTFGLYNSGPVTMRIEMGARIAHIQFEEVIGGGAGYRGQWQGGRVSTSKKEKQV